MPRHITESSAVRKAASEILYQPSSLSLIRWRALRQQVLAGKKQGHIAIMGDSIPYGAASTGASSPKPINSYPGQLRTFLNGRFGDAGSGIVLANADTRANPSWDPRFTFGGTDFLDHAFGLHSYSAWRLNGASNATLDFTDIADEFWIYTGASGGGTFTAQVDSQTAQNLTMISGAGGALSGGTVARENGFYYSGSGNSINVFKLSTGSTGSHTLKIRPSATAGQNAFILHVEARINGNGKFRVSNTSISGKSLATFISATDPAYGDATGLFGFPIMDSFKADLLLLSLGINDWQGQRVLTDTKARLVNTIARQRATAATAGGGVPYGGDICLLWNPQPNIASLGGGAYTNPSWDAYRDLYYQVADEQDVALIDLGGRWKDFATANNFGMYADTIHPNDKGAGDIAGAVYKALFLDA